MTRTFKQQEFEGTDLEDALHKASAALGIDEPELDYEILEQGRRGLFGIGAKSVRIRVMPPIQPVDADHNELTTVAITGRSKPRERGGRRNRGRGRGSRSEDGNRGADGNRRAEGNRGAEGNRRADGNRSGEGSRGAEGNRRGGGQKGRSNDRGRGQQQGNRQERVGRGRRNRRRRAPREERRGPKGEPFVANREDAEKALASLGEILQGMGLEVEAEIREVQSGTTIDLKGTDQDLLTDNSDELLAALEFLLNRMSRRSWPGTGRIHLGCNGHQSQRDDDVVGRVKEMAEQVSHTGRSKRLPPMNSYERRLAHIAVRSFEDLGSRSEGDGALKRVRVFKLRKGQKKDPEPIEEVESAGPAEAGGDDGSAEQAGTAPVEAPEAVADPAATEETARGERDGSDEETGGDDRRPRDVVEG